MFAENIQSNMQYTQSFIYSQCYFIYVHMILASKHGETLLLETFYRIYFTHQEYIKCDSSIACPNEQLRIKQSRKQLVTSLLVA